MKTTRPTESEEGEIWWISKTKPIRQEEGSECIRVTQRHSGRINRKEMEEESAIPSPEKYAKEETNAKLLYM